MNAGGSTTRTYRFGRRDTSGWLLGLQPAQCVALGAGIVVAGILLNHALPAGAVAAPMVVAVAFAFGQVGSITAHEIAPVALRWGVVRARGRHRWTASPPRFTGAGEPRVDQPELPPFLAGIEIHEATGAEWTRRGRTRAAAIVRDSRERTMTAAVRVEGGPFAVRDRAEQERLVQGWGDVLGGFCAERRSVSKVRWTEWSAPTGLDDLLGHLDEQVPDARHDALVEGYRQLLHRAGPMATRHEVLLAVTVDESRIRSHHGRDRRRAAQDTLMDELRLLIARIERSALRVEQVLDPNDIAAALRGRLEPFPQRRARSGGSSLGELAGLVGVANAGPMAVEAGWDHVRVGRALHVAYAIAEWPRLEMPANWLEPLLLHAGGIRTVAVHYEPVTPTRSQRRIDRDAVKLLTDEEQRTRTGFRTTARHRRAQADVRDREAELVAGFSELEYCGFVDVTAPDRPTLDASCAEYEQIAAECGLELRRLDGQHDLALACMLPIGRGVVARRFRW